MFTTQAGLAYLAGNRVRVSNSSSNYMEGPVASYSGTTLTVTIDRTVGSGTYASWNIGIAGDVGAGITYRAGTVSVAVGASSATVTFSSAMPNASYRVSVNSASTVNFDWGNSSNIYFNVESKTTSGFTIRIRDSSSGGLLNIDEILPFDWIAIADN